MVRASPSGEHSVSNKIANAFIESYKKTHVNDKLVYYNIVEENLPPFSATKIKGKFGMELNKDEQ